MLPSFEQAVWEQQKALDMPGCPLAIPGCPCFLAVHLAEPLTPTVQVPAKTQATSVATDETYEESWYEYKAETVGSDAATVAANEETEESSDAETAITAQVQDKGKELPANEERTSPTVGKRQDGPRANQTSIGQTTAPKNPKGANWTDEEKAQVATLMREIMGSSSDVSKTEKRWQVVRDRLQDRYGVDRTHTAVKNYWNREGRQTSGLDERNKPNPNKLVTGVQAPEQRRQLRLKRKAEDAMAKRKSRDELTDYTDSEDSEDSEDDVVISRKRQRRAR